MESFTLSIRYQKLHYGELSKEQQEGVDHARSMSEKAYAPYSSYFVGASVLLENGRRIGGNNQENAAYPSGLCAERVALFSAKSQFPQETVKTLSIFIPAVSNPIIPSPCGACRQVISEIQYAQKQSVKLVLMNGSETVWIFEDAFDILPFSFTSKHLS